MTRRRDCLMTPHFPIWSFGPKIESVDGICHQTDSMNRFDLNVKTGPYRQNVLQSMSRFTGIQFTGLPCLPVFFFRATPSPRFTGGMPVYRGGSFFHARGAPPVAAHSHTRCCTQHNTTRWVLRAAANTCLQTMPCAAGELCQLSDSTTIPSRPTSEQCFLTHNWYSSTAV